MTKRSVVLGVALALFAGGLLLPRSALAVPAFARKYQLQCTTCHTRPPRLNSFGERFLENGYQIPGTMDGGIVEKLKLGNVSLGLVNNYFAVRLRGNFYRQFDFDKQRIVDGEPKDTKELAFPEILNLFFAGTLAENVGTFIEMEGNFEEEKVEFERGMLTFNNLLHNWVGPNVAHLRIGKLDPSAYFSFPTHRQQLLPVGPQVEDDKLVRPPLVPNAGVAKFFGLSNNEGDPILPLRPILYHTPATFALDVHGRPFGEMFLYQVGIANGADEEKGDFNQQKDVYVMGRLDWARSELFSANVSAFYYFGNNSAKVADETVDWHRYGIGANVRWRMFDLYGAFIWDDIKDLSPATKAIFDNKASGLTVELDTIVTNWLLASVRYDYLNAGGFFAMKQNNSVLGLQLKFYPWDNIGLFIRDDINLRGAADNPIQNLRNTFLVGVDLAF
ncbi:MAG: hypothetical protein V3U42_03810 [candidate division NC10 bacterium]|jgi:hypothetical protein